jgi:hypothetical protein
VENKAGRIHRRPISIARCATPSHVRYSVATRSAADADCRGGDVFDVQVDGDGAVWVIIADASSKGRLGALHAAMVRSAFRMAVHLSSDPSFVVARLNEIHFELPTRDIQAYFASAFVGRIAADKPELAYASAGHDIALLFEGRAHHHLGPTGPLLGVLPADECAARTIPFGSASLLVLATDGITERTGMNAWEEPTVVRAIEATQRKTVLIAGLLTEACVAFTTLSALNAGYDVRVIVDACGASTSVAQEMTVVMLMQAGMVPRTWLQLLLELQRDWTRHATYGAASGIVKEHAGAYGIGLEYAAAMLR